MANCENYENHIEYENHALKNMIACEHYAEEVRQLKSCPFCGSETRTKVMIGQHDMIVIKVGCFDCDVWKRSKINSGDDIEKFNKAVQDAISKWNRREDNAKL